jgi:hypothetical protein
MVILVGTRSTGSVVSAATGYGMDDQGVRVASPSKIKNFTSP